jgi:predicted nucleic acid-binding protein
MKYLVDTNVLSETFRGQPNPQVITWFQTIPAEELCISVLTLGEIRKGAEKLSDLKRKQKIIRWLEYDLIAWFEDRVIEINYEVVDKWGFILAQHKDPLPAIDSLIAATALTYNMKLITRNVSDFNIQGLEVINPWES